jgi:hypothetical protein
MTLGGFLIQSEDLLSRLKFQGNSSLLQGDIRTTMYTKSSDMIHFPSIKIVMQHCDRCTKLIIHVTRLTPVHLHIPDHFAKAQYVLLKLNWHATWPPGFAEVFIPPLQTCSIVSENMKHVRHCPVCREACALDVMKLTVMKQSFLILSRPVTSFFSFCCTTFYPRMKNER